MSEKKEVIYRCPVCFARETDVVLHRHENNYYCAKCSFWGTEQKVREMYADMKKKYTLIAKRITVEDWEQEDKEEARLCASIHTKN